MYEEYINAYKKHSSIYGPNTAIFYQVGKFYEFYDLVDAEGRTQTSMRRFVDILGIKMSLKKEESGLFAGVPEQSLHKYAALLTRLGWVVVVYDQVKDTKGAVKSRSPVRILTPGTHVEAAAEAAVYIAGVWLEGSAWGSQDPPSFACMALDLTTGKSHTYEGSASGKRTSWISDDIFHFFQVYFPKECIVWWRGDAIDLPTPEFLQRQFGLPGIRIQIICEDQGGFDHPNLREEFLQTTISVRTLLPIREALSLGKRPRTERIICALLQKILEQFPSGLKYIPSPCPWTPENHLFLGNQALFQLNMVSSIQEQSVLGLFQNTYTVFGRREMRNRILYPKADPKILEERYEQIAAILSMSESDSKAFHTNLRHIEDLPRLHKRLSEGETTATEILLLDKSYISAKRLANLLANGPLAVSTAWSFETIETAMNSVFSVERAQKASEDAFCFQPGCSLEVEKVERELEELFGSLRACLEKIRSWAGLSSDSIRLEFREVMGPIITGPKAAMQNLSAAMKKGEFPYPGIQEIRKKSSSQLEIPFLETTFQKILQKREELQKIIRKVLPPLCGKIADACLDTWTALENWIATVDITGTLGRVSRERGFVRPEIQDADSSFVSIEGLRHPLIESQQSRVEYVRHNVSLGREGEDARGWLIYGMNASGKSSLMKAVGISILLAQAGCYVPATAFRFQPFRSLFTRILNTDNLWAGLSSFAVETTELREILQVAGPNSMVLGDEVCSGTESISATAIVGATLTHLHNRGAKFIFATHLHGLLDITSLKKLQHLSVWHLKVRYDAKADRLIYERTLTRGAGSSLYGLEVAKAMNLPAEVLDLAHTLRRELLGTKTELDASGSGWNSGVQRRICGLCNSEIVRDLEVHHIRPQKEANEYGVFNNGEQKDHVRNLIVVCSKCHDDIHGNKIVVHPLVQTSDGPVRPASTISSVERNSKSKWTDEETQEIRSYLQENPNMHPKNVHFYLKERGIDISAASLKGFRTKMV